MILAHYLTDCFIGFTVDGTEFDPIFRLIKHQCGIDVSAAWRSPIAHLIFNGNGLCSQKYAVLIKHCRVYTKQILILSTKIVHKILFFKKLFSYYFTSFCRICIGIGLRVIDVFLGELHSFVKINLFE